MISVLVLEDDQRFGAICVEILLACNFQPHYCSNQEEAKTLLLDTRIDIALIDLMLPPTYQTEGLQFLEHLRRQYPKITPLLMTVKATGTTELVAEAMKSGARYFFDKNSPLFEKNLRLRLKEILMERRKNIFISHGHNELLKLKLKDFINSRLGLSPIVLSEQPSGGLTIVEKLEKISEECNFAIVLMTKDDEQVNGGLRARQNVIHEIGFFQGKYGRKRVVLLAERGLEMFTNISGIVRIEFDVLSFETVFEPLRIEIDEALSSPIATN
jgi:predicted nucleotide-binding protein